jgi:putative ABC transport system permease protein
VLGILEPVVLAPGLDEAALVGFDVAERLLGADRSATTVYVRTDPEAVERVRGLLGATANRRHPEEVQVSRPSDALEARAAAKTAFTSLLLGLGAVALLVGGLGIANVMVVAVLERRSEVGLRRALGARRGDVGAQFLTEAVILAGAGGIAGVALGAAVTGVYAASQGWRVAVPPEALAGGVAAAIAIGAVAGLYPALRAARLAPAEALRSA